MFGIILVSFFVACTFMYDDKDIERTKVGSFCLGLLTLGIVGFILAAAAVAIG
jgi:hypothetical protein